MFINKWAVSHMTICGQLYLVIMTALIGFDRDSSGSQSHNVSCCR